MLLSSSHKSTAIVAVAALLLSLGIASPARADVSVVVNGQTVTFDQPPVERAGRVFVPLRGVFEHLGATVVYANGQINATGNGNTISLQIGSTNATVNGQPQTLDVAPFLIGDRTLVPLRFISQALGANVSWDDSSQVATVAMAGKSEIVRPVNDQNMASDSNIVRLTDVHPVDSTNAREPLIRAQFTQPVDPNTVRVTLDGRDVSSTTEIASTYFSFTPTYPLSQDRHVVAVTGQTPVGTTFERRFSFVAGENSAPANYLSDLIPGNGTQVSNQFTIRGRTLPNASVRITAIGGADIDGVFRIHTGTYTTEVTADQNGYFALPVSTTDIGGGDNIGIRVTSTAFDTGASITRNVTVHA